MEREPKSYEAGNMKEKEIIVVADPHLGTAPGDAELMLRFVSEVDPERARLLFLGDLFHIWAAPAKYHTAKVKMLLKVLEKFRRDGGEVHLTAGNRDIFFPEIKKPDPDCPLPFDSISLNAAFLPLKEHKIMAVHGDAINSLDKRYLLWRKLVRHRSFKALFNLLPASKTRKIMFKLEEKLKTSNMNFKREFPKQEWEKFIKEASRQSSPKMLLAGHFHPAEPIISEYSQLTAVVVPDWHGTHTYMRIKPDFKYSFQRYPR